MAALVRLRAVMLASMGSEPPVTGWERACAEAFACWLAQPDQFAAWVVDVDGALVSSGVAWLEEHLPSPSAPDGRRAASRP